MVGEHSSFKAFAHVTGINTMKQLTPEEFQQIDNDITDHRNDLDQMLKTPHLFEREIPAMRTKIASKEKMLMDSEAEDARREEYESATYDLNGNPR